MSIQDDRSLVESPLNKELHHDEEPLPNSVLAVRFDDRWTPELQMQFKTIRETGISPDGSLVAYVVREPIMELSKLDFLLEQLEDLLLLAVERTSRTGASATTMIWCPGSTRSSRWEWPTLTSCV